MNIFFLINQSKPVIQVDILEFQMIYDYFILSLIFSLLFEIFQQSRLNLSQNCMDNHSYNIYCFAKQFYNFSLISRSQINVLRTPKFGLPQPDVGSQP